VKAKAQPTRCSLYRFAKTAVQILYIEKNSCYAMFLAITALPQSTVSVERTFSGLNNNKNKLRDCSAVCCLEAVIESNENFPGDFEVNQRLIMHSHVKASKT